MTADYPGATPDAFSMGGRVRAKRHIVVPQPGDPNMRIPDGTPGTITGVCCRSLVPIFTVDFDGYGDTTVCPSEIE